ncbi:MAG: S49 family peptidase [Planctomycetota bacterium]
MPAKTISHTGRVLSAMAFVALAGCSSTKPVHVDMKGDICAAGTIKTVIATDNSARPLRARTLPREPGCAPKIALIDVDGVLLNRNLTGSGSLGENPVALFREKLEAAAGDPGVCAVLLRINSPGGGVTACDIMRQDLERFRLHTGKPVVVCMMDLGCGGAYYLATQSDMIVAHPTTLTGGLGVVLNRYDLVEALKQQNVFAKPIRSGKKVDMGSPIRNITPDEDDILNRVAGEYHRRLQEAVVAARQVLKSQVVETLAPPEEAEAGDDEDDVYDEDAPEEDPFGGTIFDGRVLTASEAVGLGMIDQLGYLDDALATARGLAGQSVTRTIVYRRSNDRALTAYDITPNLPASAVSLPLSIPGFDRSQLPIFLYLWQPEPLLERTGGL